jgi:cytochrome c-type biogenesis protein CcmH
MLAGPVVAHAQAAPPVPRRTASILGQAPVAESRPPVAIETNQDADSVIDARAREIAAVLRCPVCQGESILDSPAELAQQMRALVHEQLRDGRTPEEIKAFFVSRYGEWILLEPTMSGLNIALYVFPVLLVIGGLAFVFVMVKRWTAPSATVERAIDRSSLHSSHETDRDETGNPGVL